MKPLTAYFGIFLFSTCMVMNTVQICVAQKASFWFEQLQLPDGVAGSLEIAEDSVGFIWIGTGNGLYRYDGYSFTNYSHDPSYPYSLSSNWVETLYVDGESTLWAGTFGGGLNRFDPQNGTFTHFRHDPENPASISNDSVTVIMEDHQGHLWVGTQHGLNRMDRKTGSFTRFMYDPDDPTSLSNDQARAIFEDSKGTLWIGTNEPWSRGGDNPGPGGLNRFDRESETFIRYLHDPNDPNTLGSNHVMCIFEDSGGTFWVGTWDNGLHTMDRESGVFIRHEYDPEDPGKLGPPFWDFQTEVGGVRFIYEDNQGAIWMGGIGHGMVRYDPLTAELLRFKPDPDTPGSLASVTVWSMYESRDGMRWTTGLGGLNKIHPSQKPFEHVTLTPKHSHNIINVLGVGNSGMLHVNALFPVNTLVRFRHHKNENPSYLALSKITSKEIAIRAIAQTKDGTLWVGEGDRTRRKGGIYQLDEKTDEFIPVWVGTTNTGIEIGNVVYIFEDSGGLLWFGTKWTGLIYMNRETGQMGQYTHNPENPGSLSHSDVTTIYEAPSQPGVIWIGTEGGGLNRFDKKTETFTRFQNVPGNPNSLIGEYITSIYEESPGRLLIGTHKSGLNLLDVKNNTFTHFTSYNSGLSDNNVSCILGDKNGQIWIGTAKGLSRFEPESRSFYTFGARHGVRAFPYVSSCVCDRAGNLIFGGINGITVFNPDKINPAGSPSPVVFTNFIVEGQSVLPGPEEPLQTPIWKSREIRLPYHKTTFSFEFATLDFRDPKSNQYAYILEGFDTDWRDAGSLNRADYSQVPYGEYTFRLRAANSEGIWNMEGASIQVSILPPWWHTWWAYSGYLILIGGSIYLVYKYHLNHRLQEAEAHRLRELDAVKTKLYTNITHEFRTPLTVILGMAHQVVHNPDEHLEKGMKMIVRNGQNLLTLVNHMLDLSKLESGKLSLQFHHADVVSFLGYIVDSFHALAESKGVRVHFISAAEPINMDFDEVRLQQVVANIIYNAIKFTPKGGHVYVSTDTKNESFVLKIKDTGIGIAEADLPYIFDRFYQADDSHTRHGEGTGIGLALTHELVKLMKGTIAVKSKIGYGAEFEVVLPLRFFSDPETSIKVPLVSMDKETNHEYAIPTDMAQLPDLITPSYNEYGSAHVLIADDNEDVLGFVASCLKNEFAVDIAKNGQECEDLAFNKTPDLIVMDVMMPFKDGFGVCKTLKTDERTSHIPIIMLTAKADLESRLEGLEQGADAYLTKPFEKKELLLRARKLLELRRQLQQHYRLSLEDSLSGNPPQDQESPNTTTNSNILQNADKETQSLPLTNSLDHAFVIKVRNTIESHLEDPDFDVEKLCRFLALSHSQVHRKLSALTGLSATHFIRYLRLVKAKEMIINSGYSISAIAYDCGFNDPSYFSRVFKQEFGVSPQVWREQKAV
ncbi:hybrid sensor histidine kinase/response regulator transcription factor [Pararhodonellum marinum]|uniref:hybrid sensor histidine kinase/response regulator transcription factor n=1 Tax=Pararhodonellum marinum TaxID=2755358 RepID=UPI00189086DE|nr:hybrid sensor histidine kinase/response regulator transcription factor [Pararhodonellum marinum]